MRRNDPFRIRLLALFAITALLVLVAFGCGPRPPEFDLDGRSESVGSPNNGRLVHGAPWASRSGIRLNDPNRTWGTEETVALMNLAIDAMLEQYPDTCDLFIGDISTQKGGRLRPHISHQSGRDIDVGLYAKDNRFVAFVRMDESNLDTAKTWYFIETLLETERVQLILLDRSIQKIFYEYLAPVYSKRKLDRYLQYPNPTSNKKAIIRHAKNHANHLHIRFKCPRGNRRCEDW